MPGRCGDLLMQLEPPAPPRFTVRQAEHDGPAPPVGDLAGRNLSRNQPWFYSWEFLRRAECSSTTLILVGRTKATARIAVAT